MEQNKSNKFIPKPIDTVSVVPLESPMELYQALKNLYNNEELVGFEIDKDHVIIRTLGNLDECVKTTDSKKESICTQDISPN